MPTSEVPGRPASTMAAAVLYGPGDLRIERRPVPAPGPGQVLVRVGPVGIQQVRPGGSVVLVGMGPDELRLPFGLIQQRELKLTGTFRYAGTWPAAIALAASGPVDLDSLVTAEYALAETERALTAGRDPRQVKAVVRSEAR